MGSALPLIERGPAEPRGRWVRPLAVGERRGTNRDGHRRASLFTWYVLGGRHGSVPRSEPGEAATARHRGGASARLYDPLTSGSK